jgi:hypothetical protein
MKLLLQEENKAIEDIFSKEGTKSKKARTVEKIAAPKTTTGRTTGPCCEDCLYPNQELGAHKCPLCKKALHCLCCEEWKIPIYQDDEYLCRGCHDNIHKKETRAPTKKATQVTRKKKTTTKPDTVKNINKSSGDTTASEDESCTEGQRAPPKKATQVTRKKKNTESASRKKTTTTKPDTGDTTSSEDESGTEDQRAPPKKATQVTRKNKNTESASGKKTTTTKPDTDDTTSSEDESCTEDHNYLVEEGNRAWWKRNQMEICGGCGKLLDGQKYFYCQNTSCNHKKCEKCFKKCFESTERKGRDKKVSSRLVEV